jgi:hypothetical protein
LRYFSSAQYSFTGGFFHNAPDHLDENAIITVHAQMVFVIATLYFRASAAPIRKYQLTTQQTTPSVMGTGLQIRLLLSRLFVKNSSSTEFEYQLVQLTVSRSK